MSVTVKHTVTVECGTTGPVISEDGIDQPPPQATTLADVEAFCAELRRWEAPGDLVIPEPGNLYATVELPASPHAP